MSENTDSVSTARPRRGLPRRPGENEAVDNGALDQEANTQAPAPAEQPVKSPESTTTRRGLPRPGESAAMPTPGRRSGLPRSGTPAAPVPVSPEVAAPSESSAPRRRGFASQAASGTPPHVAPEAAQTGGKRSGLATGIASATPAMPAAAQMDENPSAQPKPLWLKAAIAVVGLLVVAGLFVLLARWLRTLEPVQAFLITYPGESHLPANAPVGFPAWLGWQHFLNAFFIVLIIRTGWQVRTQQRPPASWTRNNDGLIKTKNPPKKISLTLWAHLTLDFLWFLNGIVFVVVLFATGQWIRVVPTSWDVFPNALSALIQYISMDWPTENGWVNYNGLQLLAYFTTIFIAAPLAAITGLRMSGAWPAKAEKLNKAYPMELARAIHFPVMLYFALFVVMHVFLVFATGALRNLNHMYASQDVTSWTGFWIFLASLLVMTGAVFAARPLILAPIAQLMGKVGR